MEYLEVRLWLLQRLTAILLALFISVHLATMIWVIQGGLSAGEILSRTRGSLTWGLFYTGFVLAASIHGAIGLRTAAREHLSWSGRGLDLGTLLFGLILCGLGILAVIGVVT